MENNPMRICTPASRIESLNGENVEINYKSGAHYKGDVVDNKKYGKGKMYWPDGSVYDGNFVNDQRSGQGHQVYRDKSSYKGQFVNDKRNGYGIQKFPNGEVFEGHFFQDLHHGVGRYVWPQECEFVGLFYANNKEGYGTTKFANGNVFQGLYKDDKREGPGILTYGDTRMQDVGLWCGLRLIRIACKLPGLFSLSLYPHYRCNRPELPVITAADIWTSPSMLRDLSNVEEDYSSEVFQKIKDIYLEYPDCCNVKVNNELFNKVFLQQASGMVDLQHTCRLWNVTPSLENLQKHILKHSFKQTLINVDDILNYNRPCFNPEGPLEKFSEQLLWASACGKTLVAENLLIEDILHPDVAGKDGNTGLINGTAIGNCAMINTMLNHGANVNQLNDEGCSALAVGFVLLYHVESLHLKLLCDVPGRVPIDIEDAPAPESTPSSLITGGYNVHASTNALKPTSVLAERTNSMELESLEDYQTASPRNLISADEVDSGISRGSLVRPGKVSRKISPNNLDKKDPAKKKSIGIFPNASIPPQNSLLKSRERTSTRGRHESQRVSYSDRMMVESKHSEMKASTDLPYIQNEITKEGVSTSNSYACQVGLDSLNRSASWRKNYRVSDWMNTTNFEKAENDGKTFLQFAESPVKRETEEFTRRFVQKMSRNFFPVSQSPEKSFVVGKKNHYQECVDFLLKRGADPNSSSCPWPVLFIAVRALDVPMVKTLLLKGANPNAPLPKEEGGLCPLHIACSLPGKEGYETAELLLNSLADPDARMVSDNSYLDSTQNVESWASSGGRTPLHIACGHEDNHADTDRMVRLLLQNRANPNTLCNGISPLGVAIAQGNTFAIDGLLANGADPSLPLGNNLGNALCMVVLAQYKGKLNTSTSLQLTHDRHLLTQGANTTEVVKNEEQEIRSTGFFPEIQGPGFGYPKERKKANTRLKDAYLYINTMTKLVKYGADVLVKIPIGPDQITGSVVDYCYHLFHQDQRIANIPTHALSAAEREIYKGRKEIGAHAGTLLREAAISRQRREELPGRSKDPRNVTWEDAEGNKSGLSPASQNQTWSLMDFCYECGRSMNVKLIPCTRCKAVSFCSKVCKTRAWVTRHRNECMKEKDKKPPSKARKGNTSRSCAPSGKGAKKGSTNLREAIIKRGSI